MIESWKKSRAARHCLKRQEERLWQGERYRGVRKGALRLARAFRR